MTVSFANPTKMPLLVTPLRHPSNQNLKPTQQTLPNYLCHAAYSLITKEILITSKFSTSALCITLGTPYFYFVDLPKPGGRGEALLGIQKFSLLSCYEQLS